MRVNAPNGQQVLVTVPEGCFPGQQLQLRVPAGPAKQAPPPRAPAAPAVDPFEMMRQQDEMVRQEQERRERELREREEKDRLRQQAEQERMLARLQQQEEDRKRRVQREEQRRREEEERLAREAAQQRLAAEEARRRQQMEEAERRRQERERVEQQRRRQEKEKRKREQQQRKRKEEEEREQQQRKRKEEEEREAYQAEEDRRNRDQMAQLPQTELVRIVIPPGVMPGQQMRVNAPNGQQVLVTVPEGCFPGQQLQLRVPATPTPTPTPVPEPEPEVQTTPPQPEPAPAPEPEHSGESDAAAAAKFASEWRAFAANRSVVIDDVVIRLRDGAASADMTQVRAQLRGVLAEGDALAADIEANIHSCDPSAALAYLVRIQSVKMSFSRVEHDARNAVNATIKIQACYRGHRTRTQRTPSKQLIGRWSSLPAREKIVVEDNKWVPVERDVKGADDKPLPAGWVQDPPGSLRFVNVRTGQSQASPPDSPVPGVAAQLIVYFESAGVARILRMNARGKPMVNVKKAQAKCDMNVAEHGIEASKGDILVVTKSTQPPPLPPGWATGQLDNDTVFYYDTSNTDNVQLERPDGEQPSVEADVWEGFVEVASDTDAVTGRFPRECVEGLPSTHRLSGEVCKYEVEWRAAGPNTHRFRLVEAKGHVIKGLLKLPTKADVSSGSTLHMVHDDPTLPGFSPSRVGASAFSRPWGSLSLTRRLVKGDGGNWQRFLPAMSVLSLLVGGDENLWAIAGKYLAFRWAVENPTPQSEAAERVAKGDLVMGILNRIAGNDLDGNPLPPSASDRAKAKEATRLLSSIPPQEIAVALRRSSNGSAVPAGAETDYARLIAAFKGESKAKQLDAVRQQSALAALGVVARNAKDRAKQDVKAALKELEHDTKVGPAIAAHKQQFALDIATLLRQRPSKPEFQRKMAERQLEMELRIKAELSSSIITAA
eukprot:COSAG03_NODE_287_length_9368_cov_412.210594_4_plen_945_part_00